MWLPTVVQLTNKNVRTKIKYFYYSRNDQIEMHLCMYSQIYTLCKKILKYTINSASKGIDYLKWRWVGSVDSFVHKNKETSTNKNVFNHIFKYRKCSVVKVH